MFRLFITLWIITMPMTFVAPYYVYAESKSDPHSLNYENEESQIPKNPSNPPALIRKKPKSIPHCERYYLYQGKRYECDSNLGRDGESLRPIMAGVPSAIAELDAYQANLKKLRAAAYVGTAGVLATIVGLLMNRPPVDPISGALKPGAYVTIIGLGVAANSLIYGLSVVKTNEAHLSNAVNNYNAVRPEKAGSF